MFWQSFEEKMSSEEIEAIKKKITDRGYEVPHISAEVAWKHLVSEKIITGPEMVKLMNAILSSAPTAQQQGK